VLLQRAQIHGQENTLLTTMNSYNILWFLSNVQRATEEHQRPRTPYGDLRTSTRATNDAETQHRAVDFGTRRVGREIRGYGAIALGGWWTEVEAGMERCGAARLSTV